MNASFSEQIQNKLTMMDQENEGLIDKLKGARMFTEELTTRLLNKDKNLKASYNQIQEMLDTQ